ncbi:unnamed protein product [Brassicogethes aeneus]|uniref:Enoyl reductase (ER) domain-containing protein n=1 Tax=Brassicogethes aeneus TaxID=1431903 RepID=A0A9P0FK55_BRAAE|nr:unnamed protein product [Brassicogethes aeneus]
MAAVKLCSVAATEHKVAALTVAVIFSRAITTAKLKENNKIKQWAIHSYGDLEELQLMSSRVPIIDSPNDVQIEVKAASVNPIDLMMMKGYGKTLISLIRKENIEFPLTFGRDFSGTIVSKGHNVDTFKIGDEVYGFIPLNKQGSFKEIITADKYHIQKKPYNLSHLESSSIVYAAMTAYSALYLFGNMCMKNTNNFRVLVLGGSGGVGTLAVQLLKSQNCTVYSSCSTNAVDMVKNLGADVVFDYNDPDYLKNVSCEKYHIILDCAKFGVENVPSDWSYDQFITLNSPLLVNTDKSGLLCGFAESAKSLFETNLSKGGKQWKWGFFVPSSDGFRFINNLIQKGQIKPVIHKEFKFENLPEAFKCVEEGHLRGKVVVSI